uniref:Uncharacterized protein n=1 Tax=Arundo donax TaxID=35708 RepID=A0A0A9EWX2_ARUDO
MDRKRLERLRAARGARGKMA